MSAVRLERRGRVSWIVLNRPERLNAVEDGMRAELLDVVAEVVRDDATRVIVLTGAGRAFCAGADIAYLDALFRRRDVAALSRLVEAGGTVALAFRNTGKPVVAAVNGPAAGGGANLALACDLRLASSAASIGQTFVRIGLMPDWGGTYFLPRLVGPARALELMWSGRMVPADEALRLGLFNGVVAADQLEAEVTQLAEALVAAAPDAVARIKLAAYAGTQDELEDALARELENQKELFLGADAAEGFRAFLEKRTPVYGEAPAAEPAVRQEA